MAHPKIKPPVTPKIIPAREAPRPLSYLLLALAAAGGLWLSYDYGRRQAPAAAPVVIGAAEAGQQIKALSEERDALKQQIAGLQRDVLQAEQSLGEARKEIQRLQRTAQARPDSGRAAPPTASAAPPPTAAKAAAATPAPAPGGAPPVAADLALRLENVRIAPSDSPDTYRVSFSVRQVADAGRVTGTIWIAVNGFSNGDPRRLGFKTLSGGRSSYLKMGFDQQQDVSEALVLPANFTPKNILIEIKPYGETYTGTSGKFDWESNA